MPPPVPRFAIQKARGKGWTTLEVGEELAHAEARFRLMVRVNPRAYFRLIRLDPSPDPAVADVEFTWKLLELHDPHATGKGTAGRVSAGRPPPVRRRRRGAAERVRIPLRFYLAVLVLGALAGVAVWLRAGVAGP